jgi:mannitol/fructose-specific phosphotransferase system IIA component (Ntr-type)
MSLIVDIVESGGVLVTPGFNNFEEVVSGLVDSLIVNGQLDSGLRDDAKRAVCEREALSSTAMVEIGVSIPHARLEGVKGVIGSMAVDPAAVFYAMEGVPIRIVVVVFSAPELAGEHLNVLAGLSLLLQSEEVRRVVAAAPDATAAIASLRPRI